MTLSTVLQLRLKYLPRLLAVKRVLEVLFVHLYPRPDVPYTDVAVEWVYYCAFAFWNSYAVNCEAAPSISLDPRC